MDKTDGRTLFAESDVLHLTWAGLSFELKERLTRLIIFSHICNMYIKILTPESASHTARVGSGCLRNADRVLAGHVLCTGRLALLNPQVGYIEWRRRQVVRAHLMSQRAAAVRARHRGVVWFQLSALALIDVIQHFIQDLCQNILYYSPDLNQNMYFFVSL